MRRKRVFRNTSPDALTPDPSPKGRGEIGRRSGFPKGRGEVVRPSGYRRLAGRITAWTSKGLLTAVVLVAGIGFARQVLFWWADDAPASNEGLLASKAAEGLGDPARPHILQFGDQPWTVRRQSVAGDRQRASAMLRADCRQVVRRRSLPDLPAAKAETEFLARLRSQEPVEQEPGRWQLYEQDDAFPMAVGVRQGLVPPSRRVVTWGLALPTDTDAWTLYTFVPAGASETRPAKLAELPLPPLCRRTFSMRVVGGSGVVAFDGTGSPHDWTDFYDRWFERRNWRKTALRRGPGSTWYGQYTAPQGAVAASVDIHLRTDGGGRTRGLLMITRQTKSTSP